MGESWGIEAQEPKHPAKSMPLLFPLLWVSLPLIKNFALCLGPAIYERAGGEGPGRCSEGIRARLLG